ncbi:hypothetical protein EU546_00385 [Candidatus Thorarchaeota archaeon]|nr:MAG: hypothetical protein EU546_00385 [Candidatus Thorarchaeota archaeon]
MEALDLAHWLLRNSGPCIKYRVLRDLLDEQDVGVIARALEDMLASPEVSKWLGGLEPAFGLNDLHSSKLTAYENVMGKLVQLGLHAGLQQLDRKTLPFRTWLSENVDSLPVEAHSVFSRTIVASFLAYAGYGQTTPVMQQMLLRLESLFKFARNPDLSSVYVDKSQYRGIPKHGEPHRLINPDLYPDQQFMLPWIHDMRGIVNTPAIMENQRLKRKADKIVKMVLSPGYQEIPSSYGLAKYGTKYYVVGWGVKLPGYDSKPEGREFAEMLLTLEMLAPFPSTRKSAWFNDAMRYLDRFRTDLGTYSFPRSWLPERKTGYWVGGFRMQFDSRVGRPDAIECESTFRVLLIEQQGGLV